jgi:serine/threonine protein kinase
MATVNKFYQIKFDKELGKGVTGSVYQATRKLDKVPVAMKIVIRSKMDESHVRATEREVKALRQLDHPNIVKFYDMFEDRTNFYIALEFISGGELFDRITKKTFYYEKDAKYLLKVILQAIKHCHDRNLVHRDLKPENLMMESHDNDTKVKLVDFGFASVCDGNNLDGRMGTPIYMAPEIWDGVSYGKPVDMWAIGVITYILLGGYPPFADDKREKLIKRIKTSTYVYHPEFWTNISDQAKEFIKQLLTVAVEKRLTVDEAMAHPWVSE